MKTRHIIPMVLLGASSLWAGERETFDFGWKFRYYGLGGPGSVSRPVMADSEQPGHPAEHAADGDPRTRWCAADAAPGHYLRLMPDHTQKTARVEILWEKADAKDAVVVFRPVKGAPFRRELAAQGRKTTIDITPRRLAGIEIKVGGTHAGNWASICEVTLRNGQGKPAGLGGAMAEDAPAQPDFDETGYKDVQLPHDWAVESPFLQEEPNETGKLPWNGFGWYRKHITVPAGFDAGKERYYLDFDGVMSCPKVYVNGKLAGEWAYGYAAFRVDITPHLQAGKDNVVAVVADNKALSTRWYPGAGIYRHV